MNQTIVTLLIAVGCAAIGVAAIAGGYLAAQAARRDADAAVHDVLARETQLARLRRTRTILLGWLNILETLARGDSWRATAERAALGDVSDCDLSLVGDAGVVGTYLFTAQVLRSQNGKGLPPDAASQVASLRVKLLSAMAEQERRLVQGEAPRIIESAGKLDFFDLPTERPEPEAAGQRS